MSEKEIILTHILGCSRLELAVNKPALNPSQQKQFEDYQCRRQAGEPLQYILGTCNFMGLELGVNPSVLVPRPETEQLVDWALKYFKAGRALDIGTGSGNIAIALAKFCPQAQLVALDISGQALDIAQANAKRHGVQERIEFVQADIKDLGDDNHFNLIISNPPYVPTSQLKTLPADVQKEPREALDGGADGLDFYRAIVKYTPGLLSPSGYLMMEFGDGQANAVESLLRSQNIFSDIKIIQDLTRRDRIVAARIPGHLP